MMLLDNVEKAQPGPGDTVIDPRQPSAQRSWQCDAASNGAEEV